jgi:hypothetical protein
MIVLYFFVNYFLYLLSVFKINHLVIQIQSLILEPVLDYIGSQFIRKVL